MRARQLRTAVLGLLLAVNSVAMPTSATRGMAQDSEATTRVYDVRPLLALLQEEEAFFHGHSPLAYLAGHLHLDDYAPFGFEFDPTKAKRAFGLPKKTHPRILDWLSILDRALVDAEALLEVTDLDGFLSVEAEAWAHPVLADFMRAAEHSLRSRLKLEAWVLAAKEDQPALQGVLSQQEVEEILSGSPASFLLGPFQATGRPNRLIAVGSWSKRDLVWNVDGETAGNQTVPIPSVGPLETGFRLHVDARREASGGYAVRVRGQHSGDVKIERATTVCTGGLSLEIELPSVRLQQIGATATIEDGGGLLLGLTGQAAGERGELWLLRVSSVDENSADAEGSSMPDPFLPTGEWTAPGNDFWPALFPGPIPSGGYGWPSADARVQLSARRATPALSLALLESLIEELYADSPTVSGPLFVETEIYVGDDAELREAIRSRLTQYAGGPRRNIPLEFRFGTLGVEESTRCLEGSLESCLDLLDQSVLGVCREGDTFTFFAGREENRITDVNVEISVGIHPDNSVVSYLQEGVRITASALPTRQGRVALEARLQNQDVTGETTWRMPQVGIPHKDSTGTRLTLPQTTGTEIRGHLELVPGTWQLLGMSRFPDLERTLVCAVRVSE